MNQYTEQISPWKQNQQNIINKQHKPTNPSSKSPKLRKSLPGTHYHLQSPRFQNKAKLSTYEPYIVTPQLFKNISIKQSNFKSLPKFKNKKTLEKSKQKQSLQKISQLLSLGKSYTKLSQHKKQKKQNILRNTLHLKDRLQNIINKNEVNTIEYKIIRNKSQIIKNRYERIIGKQKNIIFLYQSYSLNKNNEGSPKKKIQNHILDKLLQDWK